MTSSNNLDALFADAELPLGHPGRRSDDTPTYFNRSLLMNQEPERDCMPDGDDAIVHYAPGDDPLCGTESIDRGLHGRPCPGGMDAPTAWNWLPRPSSRTTSTGRTASTASKRSPPGTASSGGGSSVRPARTEESPDGERVRGRATRPGKNNPIAV